MTIDGDLRSIFRRRISGHWQGFQGIPAVPDSNYCIEGVDGWVEFKQTSGWAVSFRPLQPGWIMRRVSAGGRVWTGVRRWKTPTDADELWMVPGRLVLDLAAHGLRHVRPCCGVWGGGPSRWRWDEVRRLLLSDNVAVAKADKLV